MEVEKKYHLYRLCNTEDGFDTYRLEFFREFDTELEALYALEHEKNYYFSGVYTLLPVYIRD